MSLADATKGVEVVQRYDRLKSVNATHFTRCENLAGFIAPSRLGMMGDYSIGANRTRQLYDSTTLMSAELMAMFIMGHSINPASRWMGWQMPHPATAHDDETNEWLEECRDRFLDQVGRSFFYAETPEAAIDLVGFGTGCEFMEEAPQPDNYIKRGFRGFHIRTEKTGRFLISEGPDGLVDTVYREMSMPAHLCARMWGAGTPYRLPEPIANSIQRGELDREFKIIHCVEPRSRAKQGYGNTGMPWASYWVERESKQIAKESGYITFPAMIPRYQKTPGETFGRGRGDIAFPDTWTLNSAKRMSLEDFALKTRPPVMHAHNSVVGGIRLTPGGPTAINTHGKSIRDAIMPWETGSKPEVNAIVQEDLRASIRQIFYVEQILDILSTHKSEQTAFEFGRRLELLFRLIAPTYGRIEFELLQRAADIGFETMLHGGAFSPPPDKVYQSDGMVDAVFDNPIARAMKSVDSDAFLMWINDMAPLINAGMTQVLDHIDPDNAAKGAANTRGVSARWMRGDREIAEARKARQQQEAREQQLAEAEQMAGAAGKAAPALKLLQGARGQGAA